MANQAKKNALYFVNTEIKFNLDGKEYSIRQQYGIPLNEETSAELELAYLLKTGKVSADAVQVNITSINANNSGGAGKVTSVSKEDMMAAFGSEAKPAEVPNTTTQDEIPF